MRTPVHHTICTVAALIVLMLASSPARAEDETAKSDRSVQRSRGSSLVLVLLRTKGEPGAPERVARHVEELALQAGRVVRPMLFPSASALSVEIAPEQIPAVQAHPDVKSISLIPHRTYAADFDWTKGAQSAETTKRPAVLTALYASFAGLQAFDVYSTRHGLTRGANEANPLMRGIAANPAVFWGLKAGTTAGVMWASERLWKSNKARAIVLMVVANSVSATLAANNIGVLRGQR